MRFTFKLKANFSGSHFQFKNVQNYLYMDSLDCLHRLQPFTTEISFICSSDSCYMHIQLCI